MVRGKCEDINADGTVMVTLHDSEDAVTVPGAWAYLRASLKDNRIGKFNEDDDVDFVEEGEVFTGHLVMGKPEGYGKMVYNEEDEEEDKVCYEGEFKAGAYHGQGKLEYANGDKYEGEFENGTFNGVGTWVAAGGEIYNGSFMNGLKDGRGRNVSPAGAIIIGTWKLGELDKDSALEFPPGQHWSSGHGQARGLRQVGLQRGGRGGGQGVLRG